MSAYYHAAPHWCAVCHVKHALLGGGRVVYAPHHQIGFQCLRPGEAPTKLKFYVLSYNMSIFLCFLYILDYLYSNKTGCKNCIAAHHFGSKFLFYNEKINLYSNKLTGYKNAWCLQIDPPALILYMCIVIRQGIHSILLFFYFLIK